MSNYQKHPHQPLYYYNLSNDLYDISKGFVNPYGSVTTDTETRSRPSSGKSNASSSTSKRVRAPGGLSGAIGRNSAKTHQRKDAWEDFSSCSSSSPRSSPQMGRSRFLKNHHTQLASSVHSLLDEPFSASPSSRPGSAKYSTSRPNSAMGVRTSTGQRFRAKMGIPSDRTRPMFLVDLARYIKEELKLLGAESVDHGDERRLQVFREAFSQFIEEFKTYEPLLSEIKREYEMALEAKERDLQDMEPLKGKLSVLTFQAAQEMDKVREDALSAMKDVARENEQLLEKIDTLQKELNEKRVAYERLLDDFRKKEAELRKEPPEAEMLRALQVEYAMLEKESEERLGRQFDKNNKLEKDLDGVKKELSVAMSALELEQTRLATSIPPAVHTALQKKYEEAQCQIERMKDLNSQQEKAIEELSEENKSLTQTLKRKDEEMFPDWDHIQFTFSESIKEFWEMAKGKSYNEAIIIFIREIIRSRTATKATKVASGDADQKGATGANSNAFEIEIPGLNQEPSFFVGLGNGIDVPKHLRIKGKVPNRKISKKDLLLLVKDTWEAKAVFDSDPKRIKKQNKPSSLAEFLYTYLKKRFGSQSVIAEWGYNIEEACKNYALQSAECSLFHDILKGDVSEEVHHQIETTLKNLKNAFQRLDISLHEGKAKGFVPKPDLIHILQSFWPNKTKQQFNAMSLESDQPGTTISYRWLFDPDGESSFLEVIREQENEARQTYLRDLEALLTSATKESKISCFDVQRILGSFDSQKKRLHLEAYLSRGFDTPLENLKPKTMIDKQIFLKNLKRGPLMKGSIDDDDHKSA